LRRGVIWPKGEGKTNQSGEFGELGVAEELPEIREMHMIPSNKQNSTQRVFGCGHRADNKEKGDVLRTGTNKEKER
jgi:hypothetical protein